jgi:hypothetical protein
MKKNLLIVCYLLLGFTFRSYAENALGSELTYQCVSPNTYLVNFKYLRDCDVLPAPNTIDLVIEATGCNAGRVISLNRTGPPQTLLPYCPNMPVNCLPNGPRGPEENRYSGIVTFSAAEQACPDWKLGVTVPNDSRAPTVNLLNGALFYTEAFIKLLPGINNNSPEYSTLNRPFAAVLVNQNSRYYLNAAEPDGDSLVYSLITARQAAGMPVTYKNGFSAQSPLPASFGSTFYPTDGEIRFTPNVLLQGSNRYAVVMQVNEYRKINGLVQLIGVTQKDIIIEVNPPIIYPNNLPQFKNFTVNGQSTLLPATLNVLVGQPIQVHFDTFDADTADDLMLSVVFPFSTNNPFTRGITIINNGLRPSFDLNWTPTANDVSPTPYELYLIIEDSACPIKSTVTDFFTIKVNGITGLEKERNSAAAFEVFPNPFSETVNFKFNNQKQGQEIRIYNLVGQEVDKIKLPENLEIISWENASNFAAGTYIAKLITSENTVQTLKFTKLQ